jgi:hypothetical protein
MCSVCLSSASVFTAIDYELYTEVYDSELIMISICPFFCFQIAGIRLLSLADEVDFKKLCGSSYPSNISFLTFEKVWNYILKWKLSLIFIIMFLKQNKVMYIAIIRPGNVYTDDAISLVTFIWCAQSSSLCLAWLVMLFRLRYWCFALAYFSWLCWYLTG